MLLSHLDILILGYLEIEVNLGKQSVSHQGKQKVQSVFLRHWGSDIHISLTFLSVPR